MGQWRKRLGRLRRRLQAEGLDALLVFHLPNILYLVNFHGSAGLLVVTGRDAVVFTDGRYGRQARGEVRQARVEVATGSIVAAAADWLRGRGLQRIGCEAARLSLVTHGELVRALRGAARLVAVRGWVEELRAVKGAAEVAAIRRVVRLCSCVFADVLPLVRPGVRERDLAAEIEYRMKRGGARGPAFETIVASGVRSAWPHARASERRLGKNELVIFDLGAILGDYCSDMTRTVYLGSPSAHVRRLYAAVLRAQQRAFEAVQAGVTGSQVDAVARKTLKQEKLDGYFVHGTGHGVGLEIHEEPRLGRGVRTRLVSGHVVTLEPGVYVPQWGGIRIEDMVAVRRGGAERLTPTSHELIAL